MQQLPPRAEAPQRALSTRAVAYASCGLLLALGAPAGWLAIRLASGAVAGGVAREIASQWPLYAYLVLGTAAAFVAFGLVLGVRGDRIDHAAQQFEALALSDPLTGLRNRRYFDQRLLAECARADREEKSLALIAVDLDLFKKVNDAHGHAVGDRALGHAARVLQETARLGDVACRVGGEEFSVICPGAEASDAYGIAERFRLALSATAFIYRPRVSLTITASVGVAIHARGEAPERLVVEADRALYDAKRSGRNRVVLARPHRRGGHQPLMRVLHPTPARR
jgi:diguanylate cyclase (GGDEF)-like protein